MASTHSSFYTADFVEWAWEKRDELDESKKRGLYASTLVFINAALEATLVELFRKTLRYLETGSKFHLCKNVLDFNMNGTKTTVPLSLEFDLTDRLKTDIESQLDGASFGRLNRVNNLIFGQSIEHTIGKEEWQGWCSLSQLRNVIGHGRRLEYDVAVNGDFSVSFENSQLHKPSEYLISKGVFSKSDIGQPQAYTKEDPIDLILSEKCVMVYHSLAQDIQTKYHASLPTELGKLCKFMPKIPDIAG